MAGRDVQGIVAAFSERFLADREGGRVLPLAEYQARYPGYADAIASEYGVLTGGTTSDDGPDRSARPAGERYEDRGPLGRGGMGEVRRVFDREIRREVAKKVLRRDGEGSSHPHHVMRFVEEAQIAGQLEHPGIVPVHDLGVDEDGRAYFTMSLVRGREFGEVIESVHAGRDGWTLTRALDVLVRVCDAVAFAHSRGVAHRDLKPANVMVGEFGRTHVVDWGLARVCDGSVAPRAVHSMRDALRGGETGPATLTMPGDVLGTASYMAPEQAAGDVDRVGLASDAYALGAILYQLLTGRAPYVDGESSTSDEVLALLRQGPPPSVQAIRPDAPPELVAVCNKAMARAPEDRYATVGAFADDLRAFLDVRVVRAYQSGSLAELRKWMVRNRAFAAACAAAVLALVVGLVFTAIEKHRADAAVSRAEANFATAFDAIEELSDAGWSGLVNVAEMGPDRRRVLQRAVAFYEQFIEQRTEDPLVREHLAEAYRRLGLLHGNLGQHGEEIAALEHAERLHEQRMATTPTAAVRSDRARVLADLAAVAVREGRIEDVRRLSARALGELDAAIAAEPEEIEHRRRRAETLAELANAEVNHGDLQRAFEPRARAVAAWQRVAAASGDASDLHRHAEALWNLGFTEMRAQRPDAAMVALTSAREKLEEVIRRRPEDRAPLDTLAHTWNGLGQLHASLGQDELAMAAGLECVALRRALVRRFPDQATYRIELAGNLHNLGMARQRGGQLEDALALFEEACREQEAALARAPTSAIARRYLSYHLNSLCQVLLALGRHGAAVAAAEALGPQPEGGVPQHMAASYAARAVGLAARDSALSESERAALVDDYAARSIALIQGAIDLGWAELEVLRQEPFTVLAGRRAFDAIVLR